MEHAKRRVRAVILAAGDGKRMKSTTPKVLSLLRGKPLVGHVLDHVEEAGVFSLEPVVVVCANHRLVQDSVKDRAVYAIQELQLGTGHAVAAAEPVLKESADHVAVVYGDMPFLSAASLRRLVERHLERDNTVTLLTVIVPHFEGSLAPFQSFGRIVRRSADGHIARIVEYRDATEEEKKIREVNPSYFCFRASWLWPHVKTLKNENAQGEYYLVDLLKMAIDEGEKISSIPIEPKEALGVNTQEDLILAESLIA